MTPAQACAINPHKIYATNRDCNQDVVLTPLRSAGDLAKNRFLRLLWLGKERHWLRRGRNMHGLAAVFDNLCAAFRDFRLLSHEFPQASAIYAMVSAFRAL